MGNTKGKATESKNVTFDGNDYSYYDYITVNGDSIREYSPANGTVKPGKIYTVKHVSSPDGTQRLLAREESGQPLAGKEVRISPTSEWGQTLTQAFPRWAGQFLPSEDRSKLSPVQKVLYKIFGYQQGGWLNKFADGGTTPTQQPSQEQVMRELMSIVQQAATELQSNKPGQGVQTLAQIVNDPQGAELLNMLAQQVPEIEQVIEAVSQMVGAYKCGGKAKKKVKKGAKGCIPCKKLMRIGGKLTNVMVDCEGNITSRYLAGGWLIPKGEDGLEARQKVLLDTKHNADWLKQLTGYTRQLAGPLYYKDDTTGNIYTRTAFLNTDGTYGWNDWSQISALPEGAATGTKADLEKINAYTDTYGVKLQYYDGTGWKNAESYYDNNSKSVKWKILGDATHTDFRQDDAVAGANWEAGTISEADATAAGIDASPFKTSLGTRGKYEASYNPLLGESKPSEVDITQGYINSLGGMNAAVKHERRQRRKDRLAQRSEHRAYDRNAKLSTKDTDTKNDVSVLTRDEKQSNLNLIDTNYANLASRMAAAMKAKWSNYNVGTPASATTSRSGANSLRDVLKQGGWLKKFQSGGLIPKHNKGNEFTYLDAYDVQLEQNKIIKAMWSLPGFAAYRQYDYRPIDWGNDFGDTWVPRAGTYSNGSIMWRDVRTTNSNDPGMVYIYSSSNPQDKVIRVSEDGKMVTREHIAPGPYKEFTTKELLEREKRKSNPNMRAYTFYSKLGRAKVKEIQAQLKSLGYDVEANGLINDRLVNAVKAFQKNVGITEDGMAGNTTLGKISETVNWQRPESVDLRTTVNPGWAALTIEVVDTPLDAAKGMITDSRTIDGETEYLVAGVWVDAADVTDEQINKYEKGIKASLTGKKSTPVPSNKRGGWLTKFN